MNLIRGNIIVSSDQTGDVKRGNLRVIRSLKQSKKGGGNNVRVATLFL
jgi:hypothetical protein